jgi:uncharacterized protein (DUF2236 family)
VADEGLFGPHSVTWRIHSSPITLLGGIRALLVQALHPLAIAAVIGHGEVAADVRGRFRRTSDFLITSIFGDSQAAEAAGARVRAAHRTIAGRDDVTGQIYRANDPELLLWVHCVLVESFLTAHQRYGRPLAPAEADQYVAEMVRLAQLVGLHPDDVPSRREELTRCLAGYEQVLRLTPGADYAWRLLERPPMPSIARPGWSLVFAGAIALLPSSMLEIYKRRGPSTPGPVLSLAVRIGAPLARRLGTPPPVLAAARKRAREAGVRI